MNVLVQTLHILYPNMDYCYEIKDYDIGVTLKAAIILIGQQTYRAQNCHLRLSGVLLRFRRM